jgi:hypothetical protein
MKKLDFSAHSMDVSGNCQTGGLDLSVQLNQFAEILNQISPKQVLEWHDEEDYLEEIGKEKCMQYFGLVEDTE